MSDWEKIGLAFDVLEDIEPFLCDLAERGDYQAKILHERVIAILDEDQDQ
jgi:hypothetical protein